MKVTQKTTTTLQLKHYPVVEFVVGTLISLAFLGFAVASIFSNKSTTLNCQRSQPGLVKLAKRGICQIERKNLFTQSKESLSYPLDAIHSASILTTGDSEKLVLFLQNKEIIEVFGASNNGNKSANKTEINSFLKDPKTPSVSIQDRDSQQSLVSFIFVIAGVASSCFTVLASQTSTCQFDKKTNQMSFTQTGFLGKTQTQQRLQNLERAEVEVWDDSDSVTYRLRIVLKQGEAIPLKYTYTGSIGNQQELADAINQFLGVA